MRKKKPAKMKPLKIKNYVVTADYTVRCEMTVQADSADEAIEIAEQTGGDQWMDWAVGPESVDVSHAEFVSAKA